MTASEIRDALALRWPDSEYLSIPEAPEDAARGGRKIDVLILSLWMSRGFERDAVEIKVTYSDWVRERKAASKADWWWRHSHRFWVAVPKDLATKVSEELPAGWGLLACEPGAVPKVVVKATHREAEALPWHTVIGVMRAAADAGMSALRRAEARGRAAGLAEGRLRAERESPDGAARAGLDELRGHVAKFEEASGVDLSDRWALGDIGAAVAIVRREIASPGWAASVLVRAVEDAERRLTQAVKDATKLKKAARSISRALSAAREDESDE